MPSLTWRGPNLKKRFWKGEDLTQAESREIKLTRAGSGRLGLKLRPKSFLVKNSNVDLEIL